MRVRSKVPRILFGLCALSLTAAAGACGYDSAYVAPQDGRPRVVWGAKNDPVVELGGPPPSPECGAALRLVTRHTSLPTNGATVSLADPEPIFGGDQYIVTNRVWTPYYYGPPIYVGTPGFAPRFLRPPIFAPPFVIAHPRVAPRHVGFGGGGGFSGGWSGGGGMRFGGHSGGHSGGGRMGGGGSSGGGGSGGDAGKAILVLAAIAIMVMPAIDIGLAAGRPESESQSAQVSDLVNAYNDLMRSPGSPCSVYDAYDGAGGYGPGPAMAPGVAQ